MPDYDLADSDHVVMKLSGRFFDENYSRALLTNSDFSLGDILALDRVQKGIALDAATLKALLKRGLGKAASPRCMFPPVLRRPLVARQTIF